MKKSFALAASEIRPLAPGRGSCYASDRITVERRPVGFMYRERPDNEADSGWRFLSAGDTQEYVDDPANFEIYDVNTIANYDRSIIEYLDAPVFSAFERRLGDKRFTAVPFPG
jgi:hypothetical protein